MRVRCRQDSSGAWTIPALPPQNQACVYFSTVYDDDAGMRLYVEAQLSVDEAVVLQLEGYEVFP